MISEDMDSLHYYTIINILDFDFFLFLSTLFQIKVLLKFYYGFNSSLAEQAEGVCRVGLPSVEALLKCFKSDEEESRKLRWLSTRRVRPFQQGCENEHGTELVGTQNSLSIPRFVF